MSHREEEEDNNSNSDVASDDFVFESYKEEELISNDMQQDCQNCCKNTHLKAGQQMDKICEQLDGLQVEIKLLREQQEKQSAELVMQNGKLTASNSQQLYALNSVFHEKMQMEKSRLETKKSAKEEENQELLATSLSKLADAVATMNRPAPPPLFGAKTTIAPIGIGTNMIQPNNNVPIQQKLVINESLHDKSKIIFLIVNNVANRWDNANCGADAVLTVDGLTVTKLNATQPHTSVRSKEPFSFIYPDAGAVYCCPSSSVVGIHYFEIVITKMVQKGMNFGLVCPEFDAIVGDTFMQPNISYGIGSRGSFSELGHILIAGKEGEGGYGEGDTLGCGLARMPVYKGRTKMFFTKNGQRYGKPLVLPSCIQPRLYPCVTLWNKGMAVQANFGADPAKPFMFNIDATEHQTMLMEIVV